MPHFIYGAGDEALRLTKEYIQNERDLALLRVGHYNDNLFNLINRCVNRPLIDAINWP